MFKEGYCFYEENLTKPIEKEFYRNAYESMKNRKAAISFDYHDVSSQRAKEIIKGICMDHPSLFYVDMYGGCYQAGMPAHYYFKYIYDEKTAQQYEEQIKKIIMNFFDQYKILTLNRYNRILILHNFISSICVYDPEVARGGNGVKEDYNVIGVFERKISVCMGFSFVYKLLCDYASVPCFIAIGTCHSEGKHAWNLVEYEGEFYNLDSTWDLSKNKNKGLFGLYTYFLFDNDWISKTRKFDEGFEYPQNKNGIHNVFFEKNNYTVSSVNELDEYIYQKLQEYPKEIVVYIKTNQVVSLYDIERNVHNAFRRFNLVYQEKFSYVLDTSDLRYQIVRLVINSF